MIGDINVTIYYGPQSWFDQEIGSLESMPLLEIVYERDERARIVWHRVDGQSAPTEGDEDEDGPEDIVAGSGDYASLNEHAITNFAGLVRSIRPQNVHLHNPPTQIQAQLNRSFTVQVKRYRYPSITIDLLRRINEGWATHLTGQDEVRERILTALYPLTKAERAKPVVLMLFGPSGVGKTETARFINELLGGTLMRKQLSMYHSEKFASYLFGGAHSEHSFAHDLLDRESGLILLDEFDKANVAFHSAFYQMFDDGFYEDKNYTVDLGPALIVCTTNYQSESDAISSLGDALCSRFDAMIEYAPLPKDVVREILGKMVDDRYEKLTPEERKYFGVEEISAVKDGLQKMADRESNVRRLGKLVDEVISLVLVRSMF